MKARLHMPDWQDGAIVPVAYPLMLEPVERTVYLDQREPFNFASLLMSPMMLMVGFSVVMVVVMPYLTRQLGAYFHVDVECSSTIQSSRSSGRSRNRVPPHRRFTRLS